MTLFQANSREKLTVSVYDACGWQRPEAMRRLRRFLRCLRTNVSHRMSWKLIRRLYSIYRVFGRRRITVYSGFRHRRVALLKRSRHTRGLAMDFHVDGVSNRRLRDYLLRTYKHAGVGYYPHTPFVHLDVRDKGTFWVDVSYPGQRGRYVNGEEYLRKERIRQRARLARKRRAKAKRRLARRGANKRRRLARRGAKKLARAVKPGRARAGHPSASRRRAAAKASRSPAPRKTPSSRRLGRVARGGRAHPSAARVIGPSPVGPAPRPRVSQPHRAL